LTGRYGGLSPSIVGADDTARVDLIALDKFVEGFAAKHLRAKGKKAMEINRADVAELVDARDLKSLDGNVVWVRVPPPAPDVLDGRARGGT
jgi:hypothetical protein